MTLEQARKLLKEKAIGVSDTVIKNEIEIADLLKDIFFETIKKNSKCNNYLDEQA